MSSRLLVFGLCAAVCLTALVLFRYDDGVGLSGMALSTPANEQAGLELPSDQAPALRSEPLPQQIRSELEPPGTSESTSAEASDSPASSRDPIFDPNQALPEPAAPTVAAVYEDPALFKKFLGTIDGIGELHKRLTDSDLTILQNHIRPFVDEMLGEGKRSLDANLRWRERWSPPPGSPQPFSTSEEANEYAKQFYDSQGRRTRLIVERRTDDGRYYVIVADPFLDRDVYEAKKALLDRAQVVRNSILEWVIVRTK